MRSYQITKQTPTTINGWIVGEYLIEGKRGARYTTFRRPGAKSVQFENLRNGFRDVAIKGNYSLLVATLDHFAVEFTDADRVAA